VRRIVVTAGLVAVLAWACGRDARLSGRKIPTVHVRSVSHYGVTLDSQASPEQVAFALLRAIRDDFESPDAASREKALSVQFDLCAANELAPRKKTNLSRDERIFRIVDLWTPTVSHYVRNFETDWDKARVKLMRREPKAPTTSKSGAEETEVAMVCDDPSGDPNSRVVLIIWLVKDTGFWRVTHLGFDPKMRFLAASAAQPTAGS